MVLPNRLERVLASAAEGQGPSQEECAYLLGLPTDSQEAAVMVAVADALSRSRFDRSAILLAQIGIETAPCPGNCKFCAFGEEHTEFKESRLPLEEILRRTRSLSERGDLYALFLMTMHKTDMDFLLKTVGSVRKELPAQTQIVVNIGDFDLHQAEELKSSGVSGAYHVCRLREGVDTSLDPARRRQTMSVIRDAGLDLYYCCEPVGPEHTPDELAAQLFLGIEYGCFQHAAMRRVFVPGAPLAVHGQITEHRLAQVVAVVAMATLSCRETRSIAVHEPNLLGLAAGANTVYAESGANPRDTKTETSGHRGLDMATCRRMLYEAGFDHLLRADRTAVPLDLNYILKGGTP